MCFAPQRRALFEHQLPKVVRACNVFGILSLRCASPHNSVHFFNISTSKSAPKWCAFIILTAKCASRHNDVHFLTIFWTSKSAPVQTRRAFDILTSTCASATKGCTFWRSELPKVRWQWGVLCIFTAACNFASLISPDGSAPAEPPELQNIGKTVFCDFSTWIFFLLPFSSLIFFLLPVFSLTLPTSAFPSVHIVGSLTSKLHSHILYYKIDPYEVKKPGNQWNLKKPCKKKAISGLKKPYMTASWSYNSQLQFIQPINLRLTVKFLQRLLKRSPLLLQLFTYLFQPYWCRWGTPLATKWAPGQTQNAIDPMLRPGSRARKLLAPQGGLSGAVEATSNFLCGFSVG